MENTSLAKSLEKGLGHAVLQVQSGEAVQFREVILHALIHDLRYDSQFSSLRRTLEERDGQAEARNAVQQEAATHPTIARLVEEERARDQEWKNGQEERRLLRIVDDWNYEYMNKAIRQGGMAANPGSLARSGRGASAEDLDQIARNLEGEEDQKRLRSYLSVFRDRQFPGDPEVIMPLIRSENQQLAFVAASVLSHVIHPGVRVLALEPGGEEERRALAVRLLRANFQPGDFSWLEAVLQAEQDYDQVHFLACAIEDVVKDHPEQDAEFLLLQLYERNPCTICRCDIVKLLQEISGLPDWMQAECRWDANEDTRALVGGPARGGLQPC